MATRMQQRRGTAAQWTAANPILAAGEIGFETDTNKFKIGNGATAWTALDYFANSSALTALLTGAPGTLDTLNELAAAINDDPNFFSSVADQIADAIAGAEDNYPALAGAGIEWNAGTNAFDIDSTVATTSYADNAVTVHNQDSTGVHGITDTAALVTLSGTQQLANKTLLSPLISTPTGLTKADVGLENVDNVSDSLKPVSTATQTALDLKAPVNNPTFTGTVAGITKGMVGLGQVDNISDENKPISTLTQAALDAKAPLANPQFTGVVYGVTKAMVGLDLANNTADLDKPVSNATQVALDNKLALSGGTLVGYLTTHANPSDSLHVANKRYVDAIATGLHIHAAVVAATSANINLSTAVANGSTLDGVTLATGDRILIKNQTTASENGIYIVAATGAPTRASDFDTHEEIHGGDFVFVKGGTVYDNTGWVQTATVNTVGTDPIEFTQFSGAGTFLAGNGLTLTGSTFSADLGVLAPKNSPTFTGTVSGVTKAMVGLQNVDNTSDEGKPVSTATQTALDPKANLNAPTFTGTVSGITKSMVGLGNVDNTTDAGKPVSTATQTALDLKAPIADPTFTGTVTVGAPGVAFSDGTQTKEGVPSRTTIIQRTDSYTLAALTERDSLIEINKSSAATLTIPTNATVAWPIGTSIDILQTGTGQVTIAGAAGVTVNATPGLKLRTQWSSASLLKRGTDSWVVVGDLTA